MQCEVESDIKMSVLERYISSKTHLLEGVWENPEALHTIDERRERIYSMGHVNPCGHPHVVCEPQSALWLYVLD